MDYIEPIPFLVIMTLIVAAWLTLTIRDRARARRIAATERLRRATFDRQHVLGLCAHVWRPTGRAPLAVCSRPFEHTGPHLSRSGQLDR